jgi:uncharacterized RDD family membrane protein YckC
MNIHDPYLREKEHDAQQREAHGAGLIAGAIFLLLVGAAALAFVILFPALPSNPPAPSSQVPPTTQGE